jgi:Winged helix-turn helix
VTDRNSPQKHVWRAQIVLLTADGCGTMELTRRTGTSKTSVWRWQERFLAEGVPGLLRLRRWLMADWTAFGERPAASGEVVLLRRSGI